MNQPIQIKMSIPSIGSLLEPN